MSPSPRIARFLGLLLALAAALGAALAGQPARAANPAVAYVYDSDTAARDSFKAELTLRGFAVTAVSLAEADAALDPNFSQYDVIIIGHDTGDIGGSAWLGTALARDRIVRAGKYTVGVGFGGAQFFDLVGLNIGFSHGATSLSSRVQAVNPADTIWASPNPIAILAGGWSQLYPGDVGGRFANPPSMAGVVPIGRYVDVQGLPLYPIAAESLAGAPQCFLLWGHRGSTAYMTPNGRDLFENLLRANPCAAQARPKADIGVAKQGPADAKVGEPITYLITVSNPGKLPAPGVRVVDQLPAATVLVSATPSQGSCAAKPAEVVCELGDLAAGASATVSVVLKATEVGTIINRASAGGKFEDTDPSNNSAQASTTVGYSPLFPVFKALPYKPVFNGPIIAPSLPKDLSIFGVEITQGIQCFDTSKGLAGCADNSLPMVARKSTVARIYLRYDGPLSSLSNIPVRLVLYDANNVEYVVNTSGKALKAIDQSAAANSANVYFSVNFNSKVPVRYYALVDPNNTIAETNESNNRYPAAGTKSIDFTPSSTMKIVGQRLRYHPSGYSGAQYAGGWAVSGGAALWFNQLLPIRSGGVAYQVASGYMDWTTSLGSGSGQHSLISALNLRWIQQNALSWLFGTGAYTGARHLYGWAPNDGYSGGHADMPVYPHAGGLGVVAIGTDRPGTSSDNPGGGALIFGHELVHDYDVKHTDTPDSCGSEDTSSAFPYGSSSIQEFGFNPVTGKVYDPASTHDLMSYCPAGGSKQGWISPYTWSYMFNKLKGSGLAGLAATADVAVTINLSVSNPDLGPEAGVFSEVSKINAPTELVTPAPGDYAVELRAGTTVLATVPFGVTFHSEYSGHGGPGDPADTASASAHMTIAWADGTTELAIMHNGVQIGSRAVSAAAPVVQFTSPSGPESWAAGSSHTLSWQAQDADSAGLSYTLLYSRDGADWDIIAGGLSATSYEVQTDSLAGSAAGRFRVVVSDGVNIGDDESPEISVPDQAPVASILNPLDGSDVASEELLVLQGFGGDMEDGALPDIAMEWKSDGQSVGMGSSLPLESLSAGPHTITLTVTDSGGQSATATAEIFVGARAYLPLLQR